MDLTRFGFVQTIIDFVTHLPPLLQLILGGFLTFAMIKVFMVIVDFIEDRREGKR